MATESKLLTAFRATGISYGVASKQMGIAKTSLHAALHGSPKSGNNPKPVERTIRAWLDNRDGKEFFKSRTLTNAVAQSGLTISYLAAAMQMPVVELQAAIRSGEWKSERDYRRFQALWEEARKQNKGATMLTKISLPVEAQAHFGLKRDPFTNEMINSEDVLDLKENSRAEKKIMNAVDSMGWVAITGPVGSGKTTLLKGVEARLAKRPEVIIVKPRIIEKQFLAASHVCDSLLEDLGTITVPTRGTLEHKARLVGRSLNEAFRDGKRVVILIDEAHLLRDDALLALKRIFEFEIGFRKLLAIVLVGQVSLAQRLKSNFTLAEVSQRVDLFEIGSLNGTLGLYIRHKLERAGAASGRDVFDAAAVRAIGERAATPLAVNNMAAAAMMAAWDLRETKVTPQIIDAIHVGT